MVTGSSGPRDTPASACTAAQAVTVSSTGRVWLQLLLGRGGDAQRDRVGGAQVGAGAGQQVAEFGRGGGPARAHDGAQAGDPGAVAIRIAPWTVALRPGGAGTVVTFPILRPEWSGAASRRRPGAGRRRPAARRTPSGADSAPTTASASTASGSPARSTSAIRSSSAGPDPVEHHLGRDVQPARRVDDHIAQQAKTSRAVAWGPKSRHRVLDRADRRLHPGRPQQPGMVGGEVGHREHQPLGGGHPAGWPRLQHL